MADSFVVDGSRIVLPNRDRQVSGHVTKGGMFGQMRYVERPQIETFVGSLRSESCPDRRMAANLEVQSFAPYRNFDT